LSVFEHLRFCFVFFRCSRARANCWSLLRCCWCISVLDLSTNQYADPAILDYLEKLPGLRVLYLKGSCSFDQFSCLFISVLDLLSHASSPSCRQSCCVQD
jgi:hypothetical protein